MTAIVRSALLAAVALVAAGAEARIYGFIDAKGVLHVTNLRQEDRRYVVYLDEERGRKGSAAAKSGRRQQDAGATASQQGRRRAYQERIAEAAVALRMDSALLHAVVAAESGYDPRARSGKGAMGLMQLMPETARRYCVDDPYDPVQNLRGGSLYLNDLLRRYDNDLTLALAAYNAGEGAVARHGNRIPPYAETRDYVPRVLALYARYRKEAEGAPRREAAPPPAFRAGTCGG